MGGENLKSAKEWTQSVLEALGIIFLLFIFLWPVKVVGVSMLPSVNDGDRVLISRFAGKAGLYDRGDMVVFDEEGYDNSLIKRVIAIGGDTISIENGIVYLNGDLLEESYTEGDNGENLYLEVPEGMVFVMGDNRSESIDSRKFGPVSEKEIYGKVLFRFYPFNKMKVI